MKITKTGVSYYEPNNNKCNAPLVSSYVVKIKQNKSFLGFFNTNYHLFLTKQFLLQSYVILKKLIPTYTAYLELSN